MSVLKKSVSNLSKGNSFRICGLSKSPKAGEYTSTSTRFASLQGFTGGAEITEVQEMPAQMPHDESEDLEAKFNSGVNRSDIPRMWGHSDVIRKLGNKSLSLANEIRAWRRNGGEPLYKKAR